ncbi:MAG: Fic family protein [Chthoniobacterales bacterium]
MLTTPGTKQYLHWDKIRHLRRPEGFTHEEWWAAIKIGRMQGLRAIPLLDCHGVTFSFSIPDEVSKRLHEIDLGAGGRIGMPGPVINSQTRDQYLINSLMQEAITSSQLEGAVTTREVAKEMLLSGRAPRDTSERMILNNFLTMKRITELRDQPLSPELVLEIHRRVTEGTLDKADAGGRFRLSTEEVNVVDITGEVFHSPPRAEELPERMEKMCDFANEKSPNYFVHPVVRAILLHFWLAYDHPFVDGNGRTARALFYWSMLRQGYWLFEFISISDILRNAPAKYARAFLYTETDDNDATYFLVHQVEVIHRAIQALHDYIQHKSEEVRQMEGMLHGWDDLNHRQIAMLGHAMRHPGAIYTIEGHQRSHNIVYETARRDLLALEHKGFLEKTKRGKEMIFRSPRDLEKRIAGRDHEKF